MLGRILVGLGGLLVALLFAALIAPLFIDWTGFRQEFEEQASRIIGKKVVVHGTVDARFIPFPSVTLHDVRVGSEADGTPLVQVAEFSMDAELAPFLSGEALIFDMRISKPKARIRLLKDGRLDWMRGSQASIPAKTVVLENVRISDGDIEFIDEQSGRTRRVTGLNADMSATSLAGPWRIDGSGALDGEKGRFTLSTGMPDPRGEGLRLKARILPEGRPVGVDLEGALTVAEGKPSYLGDLQRHLHRRGRGQRQDPHRAAPQGWLRADQREDPHSRLPAGARRGRRPLCDHRRGDARHRQAAAIPADCRWPADRRQPAEL